MGVYKRVDSKGLSRWYIRYWHAGHEYREAAGPTKGHATALLATRRCEQADSKRTGEPFAPGGYTLGDALDEYLESRRALGRRSVGRMEEHAAKIRARLGTTQAVELTSDAVEKYAAARRDEDGRAPATCNRELALIRASLRLAADAGKAGRVPRIRLLREPPGLVRYLSDDELAHLLGTCAPDLRRLVEVLVNTGMRLREARELRWRDVDLTGRLLHVEHTKTGRRRDVPINDPCLAALGRQGKPDALVLRTSRGKAWKESNAIQRFGRACTALKLDDVTLHTLRHTAGSRVAMRSGNLKAVQDLLGHSTITLAARYSHLAAGHLAQVVSQIASPEPVAPDNRPETPSAYDAPGLPGVRRVLGWVVAAGVAIVAGRGSGAATWHPRAVPPRRSGLVRAAPIR